MPPELPRVSSLQHLALSLLASGPRSGRDLREQVRGFGVRRTRAAFYQFMARLERDGWVAGDYVQARAEGRTVTERRYELTPSGREVLAEARAFYRALDGIAVAGGSDA